MALRAHMRMLLGLRWAANGRQHTLAAECDFTRRACSTSSPAAVPESTSSGNLYRLEVIIKSHEPRWIEQARNTIRDLLMLNLSPKSIAALPWDDPEARDTGVYMPNSYEDTRVQRWRTTVTRGPHIDKRGQETFELRTYRNVVRAATPSLAEVRMFIDSVKLYELTGVQLEVAVSSHAYVLPSQAHSGSSGSAPVLSQHLRGLAAAAGGLAPPLPAPSDELSAQLRTLRDVMQGSVQGPGGSSSSSAAGLPPREQQLLSAMERLRLELAAAATSSGGVGGGGPEDAQLRQQRAFVAAVDAALLGLDMDVLRRHQLFNLVTFATCAPGSTQVPAAHWMHAVLKSGQFAAALHAACHGSSLASHYSQYSLFSHTLLHALFRLWIQPSQQHGSPARSAGPVSVGRLSDAGGSSRAEAGRQPAAAVPSRRQTERFMGRSLPSGSGVDSS